MPYSRTTKAALARAVDTAFTHGEFDVMFFEYEIEDFDRGGGKTGRAAAIIRGLDARRPDDHAIWTELIEKVVERDRDPVAVGELVRSLAVDGYEYGGGRVRPTIPPVAGLPQAVSALEERLERRGFQIALRHYQQAADSFLRGAHEAANGQTRSCLEDLFVQLCREWAGREFDDGSAALQHLLHKHHLDRSEYNLLRAAWDNIQDNGPHRGLTNVAEATFRLRLVTALADYLLTLDRS